MYNRATEEQIKNAPEIDGVNLDNLPEYLTTAYAQIVSFRLTLATNETGRENELVSFRERLRLIANTCQAYVVLLPKSNKRDSAAFVAATAHQLLSSIDKLIFDFIPTTELERDYISSDYASILLFLISNNPSDAIEIAKKLNQNEDGSVNVRSLKKILRYLGLAKFNKILKVEIPNVDDSNENNFEAIAINYLWKLISQGIKDLAQKIAKGDDQPNPKATFEEVINLAVEEINLEDDLIKSFSVFAGPHHLASLLSILSEDLLSRAITFVPPPSLIEGKKWRRTIKQFAKDRPLLWQNHNAAIKRNLLEPGVSAVITFPTGAGKSTLSELKIAVSILRNKKVIYLVPTHALGDQVRVSLSKRFKLRIDKGILRDSEYSEAIENTFSEITVMTPERCLALVGVEPNLFSSIDLVVFDECHLIDKKNDRRGLDAMLCLLRLFELAPKADYLLISAMVRNGEDIASWLESVLGRKCLNLNDNWKPTRQIRGCIVYEKDELEKLKSKISAKKKEGKTKNPNKGLKDSMQIDPIGIFSIKTLWETNNRGDYKMLKVLPKSVNLGISNFWSLSPNKNMVAAELAANFAKNGIKTLVFSTNPTIVNSTARKTASILKQSGSQESEYSEIQKNLIRKAGMELGGEKYVFTLSEGRVGVHHGLMIPDERLLNEELFSKSNKVNVLFATPTLAQGINLPAEIVIIAGDDRFDPKSEKNVKVEAFELLNAAGRAGRAGMVAQGVVIIIPGKVVGVRNRTIDRGWWNLKKDVFSNADQCLDLEDPIQFWMDSIYNEFSASDEQQNYFLSRLPSIQEGNGDGFLKKSYYSYNNNVRYEKRLEKLRSIKKDRDADSEVTWREEIASKNGLPISLVEILSTEIKTKIANNDQDISNLLSWIFIFLEQKQDICKVLFRDPDFQKHTLFMVQKWIEGRTYREIERSTKETQIKKCQRSRKFVLRFIPELSFVCGLITQLTRELVEHDEFDYEIPIPLTVFSSCIREGFDIPEKLALKILNPNKTRIECHQLFNENSEIFIVDYSDFKEMLTAIRKLI